ILLGAGDAADEGVLLQHNRLPPRAGQLPRSSQSGGAAPDDGALALGHVRLFSPWKVLCRMERPLPSECCSPPECCRGARWPSTNPSPQYQWWKRCQPAPTTVTRQPALRWRKANMRPLAIKTPAIIVAATI